RATPEARGRPTPPAPHAFPPRPQPLRAVAPRRQYQTPRASLTRLRLTLCLTSRLARERQPKAILYPLDRRHLRAEGRRRAAPLQVVQQSPEHRPSLLHAQQPRRITDEILQPHRPRFLHRLRQALARP